MAVDASGNAFVTGQTSSDDFPTTPGPLNQTIGLPDIFVTEILPDGAGAVYSALVGGSGWEVARAVALGPDGSAYVAGQTTSWDYPITPGALSGAPQGGNDGVVTRVKTSG